VRVIGLDVHRTMAVAAILEEDRFSSGGRIELTRDAVIAFGQTLRPDDEVVVDRTRLFPAAQSDGTDSPDLPLHLRAGASSGRTDDLGGEAMAIVRVDGPSDGPTETVAVTKPKMCITSPESPQTRPSPATNLGVRRHYVRPLTASHHRH
jgi:hypothetical protein